LAVTRTPPDAGTVPAVRPERTFLYHEIDVPIELVSSVGPRISSPTHVAGRNPDVWVAIGRGEAIRIVIGVKSPCQHHLAAVVQALNRLRLELGAAQGGQQQGGQDGNDGDDHQQFNQRKPASAGGGPWIKIHEFDLFVYPERQAFRAPAPPSFRPEAAVGGDPGHCPTAAKIRDHHRKLLQIIVKSSDIVQWINSNAGADMGRGQAATLLRPLAIDVGANRQRNSLRVKIIYQ
jgi:hypothetical protein